MIYLNSTYDYSLYPRRTFPSRVLLPLHRASQNFRQSRLNEIAIDLSTSSLPFSPVAAANTEKCDEARCTCSTIYKFDVPAVAFTSRFFTLIALSHVIRFSRNSLRPGVSLTLLMFGEKKRTKKKRRSRRNSAKRREQRSYLHYKITWLRNYRMEARMCW